MRLRNIIIILTMIFMPAVYAEHFSLDEVEALENQCKAAEEPVFKILREKYIADCEEMEKNNRGDPTVCAERYKDVTPVAKHDPPRDLIIAINPPLPICVKAREARDYYDLNP